MYPVPGICPVCGDELAVTRLHCGRCATTLEGLFTLGRFHYLTREQQQFIGIFIKCRGKIKDVEQALDISYPTVVKLLDEVVAALEVDTVEMPEPPALAPPDEPVISPERRRAILDDLSSGRISSAEALRLLQGGDDTPVAEAPTVEAPTITAPMVEAPAVAETAAPEADDSLVSAE
jgi:hypothetical protein